MTNENTAAKTEASSKGNTVAWPQRFGTVKSVALKNGRNGRYAIITVDCKKFEQVAYAFTEKVIQQMLDAGEGAQVWMKGPFEPVQRKNANGGTYTEDQMKVVYFKDKTDRSEGKAETGAAEGETPEAAETGEAGAAEGTAAEGVSGETASTEQKQVENEIAF